MSADATETAAEPSAGGKKPILLVAAIVVALAAGGAVGALVVGPALAAGVAPATAEAALHAKPGKAKSADHADDADADDEADDGDDGDDESAGEEKKGGEKEGEGKDASTVHVLDNLVLNPAGSGGTRFLLLTTAFDMKNAALAEQLKERDAEVRDAVIATLSAKTVEQLSDPAAREPLKEELKAVVGKVVRKKKGVRRVYFPQFVIQ